MCLGAGNAGQFSNPICGGDPKRSAEAGTKSSKVEARNAKNNENLGLGAGNASQFSNHTFASVPKGSEGASTNRMPREPVEDVRKIRADADEEEGNGENVEKAATLWLI